jgi:hypothetical protein
MFGSCEANGAKFKSEGTRQTRQTHPGVAVLRQRDTNNKPVLLLIAVDRKLVGQVFTRVSQ